MIAGDGVDQLRGDADAIATLADAPLQDVTHAQFVGDALHVNCLALVDELRAMTKNQRSFDRPVMMSSEMPSAK